MQRFLFIIIISLLSLSLFSQVLSKQEGIECNLRSIDTILSYKRPFNTLSITPNLSSIDISDINRWAADLQASKFSESGLELSGGYDYRFWNYNIIDDTYDGGDAIPYKHRFLVSLKWNIMQSGLVGRENFRQKVGILSRTKNQELVNNTIKLFVMESAELQIANLHSYLNVLIEAKAELYSVLIEMQEELVAKNKATMLSLSDMKIKRANVLRMRKNDIQPKSGVIDLNSYVESQNLYTLNEYDSLVESNNMILKNKLEQELTLNEADGITYWQEIKVSPYIRMSNYLNEDNNCKNIGNLGVTASFPLFTSTRSKRREVLSRNKLLANDEQQIRKDISHKIANSVQQLNENFITLQVLAENIEHYNEGCKLAMQYYNNNTITIQELSYRYIDYLDNYIEIYKLIIEREQIKSTLFKEAYGI